MANEQPVQEVEGILKEAFNNAVTGIGYKASAFNDMSALKSEGFLKIAFDLADKLISIKSDHTEETLREVNEAFIQACSRVAKGVVPGGDPALPERFANMALKIADRIILDKTGPLVMSDELRTAIKIVGRGPSAR